MIPSTESMRMRPDGAPSTRAWQTRAASACALCAAVALASCASPPPADSPAPDARPIDLGPGLRVDRARREVTVEAEVASDRGWLEQAACKAGTREHESLLAIEVPPSRIHAALLLAGAVPGSPGSWTQGPDGTSVARVRPTGTPLELLVRTPSGDVPLSDWVHDPGKARPFPPQPWVFAGSRTRPNTPSMGPGEHYVADRTGSIVGIVTFGDETIAFDEVLADQAEVDAPQWQARTERMPAPGTRVQLVIRVAATASGAPAREGRVP